MSRRRNSLSDVLIATCWSRYRTTTVCGTLVRTSSLTSVCRSAREICIYSGLLPIYRSADDKVLLLLDPNTAKLLGMPDSSVTLISERSTSRVDLQRSYASVLCDIQSIFGKYRSPQKCVTMQTELHRKLYIKCYPTAMHSVLQSERAFLCH